MELGIGLIGGGFMGRCHAHAFRNVGALFPGLPRLRLELLADLDAAAAQRAAATLGFARATADWQALAADPAVDIVAITTPNRWHAPMALAALAAGKHVYCEKPLALGAAEAVAMRDAAAAAGVRTQLGFNYLCSPMIGLARDMIAAGELGRVVRFAATFDEDYMADPAVPFSWRNQRDEAGPGALGDLGSHAIAMALYLVGPIASLTADLATIVPERRDASGTPRPSENDDAAHLLVRFANGAVGTLATCWAVHGRKNRLAFEVAGTRGTLVFDQERFNELQLFETGARKGRGGYRTILAGPDHPDYAAFCPAAGHGLGFNDLKVIEVKRLLEAIAAGHDAAADFRFGAAVQAVSDAAIESAARRAWVAPRG